MRTSRTGLPTASRRFDADTVTFRSPRLTDAAGWSAARIAEERRLRPAFGDPDRDWAQDQSELSFVERCLRLRLAQARGLAIPGVIEIDGDDTAAGARILGEVGIDGIDRRTGTGELSAWSADGAGRGRIVGWATATLLLHAFTMPSPLRRIVAPQVIHNPAPPRSLTVFGARSEMTITKHRLYNGIWTDHRLWVVHNTSTTRSSLAAAVER